MSQIVRWDAKKGDVFVHALDLRLDKDVAARAGRTYGIVAADTPGRKGQALAAHLEDAFTRGAAEAVQKLPVDATQDQVFEAAIGRVNHALGRLFGEYGLEVEPERVTAAIVAIRDHDVVAATWGRPSVLLYHPMPNDGARAFDLVDDSRADASSRNAANPRRCFGSIISGRMGKRDRLVVASHDLRAFLGEDTLATAALAENPEAGATLVNRLLAPLGPESAVAALILAVAEVRYVESDPSLAPPARAAAESATNASIAKLLKTRSETVQTMTPSLVGDLGRKVTGLMARDAAQQRPDAAPSFAKAPSYAKAPEGKSGGRPTDAMPPMASAHGSTQDNEDSVALLTALAAIRTVGKVAFAALRATGSFLLMMASKTKRETAIRNFHNGVDGAMNGLVERFNGLKTLGRLGLFAILSLAFVGRGMLITAEIRGIQEGKIAAYERAVSAVQQKIDSAEASVIYRDEGRARELLAEAATAVALLPEKHADELAAKDGLRKRIAASKDALRRQVMLPAPDIVASISTGGETPSLAKLAPSTDAAWAASAKGEVFKISLKDGATEKVTDVPGGAPDVFVAQGKDVYVAAASGAGALVTLAGRTTTRDVDFGGAESTVADAGIYNARLYVLDAAHNRIMRHVAGDGGYGKAQFYLKDGTDLSQGVSLAIDGMVYVLRKDGSIVRIAQGKQEPFAVAAADPAVTAPLRLRTEGDDGDLFVLDSSPARILRYSKKSGALLAQYVSDSLKGATDFTVDAKGTTALVSVGNQILRFALPDPK